MLHAFKYDGRRSLAPALAALVRDQAADLLATADLLVPVPLHRARRRARGFNQAHDLAAAIGGPPVLAALRRTRATTAQTALTAGARRRNVRGAFARGRRRLGPGTLDARGAHGRHDRRDRRAGGGAGRRRHHDRRDAGGVRRRAAGGGRGGGPRGYGSASRDRTAAVTAAATASLGCSPSIRVQVGGRRRLAAVALADAAEECRVALVAIAALLLAGHGGLGRDVEEQRQVGLRQVALDVDQPRGIQPERLAVGDARGQVAIADDDGTGGQPLEDHRLALVAVGHVEQLHHVRLPAMPAGELGADLLADRRRVVREGQRLDAVPRRLELGSKARRLGFLAALVEPLERDQGHSRRTMSSIDCGRRMTRQRPSSTSTSGASGRRL